MLVDTGAILLAHAGWIVWVQALLAIRLLTFATMTGLALCLARKDDIPLIFEAFTASAFGRWTKPRKPCPHNAAVCSSRTEENA